MGDEDSYLTQPYRPSYAFIALLSHTKNTKVVSPLRRSIKETFDMATVQIKNQVGTDIVKSPHGSRSRETQIGFNGLRNFVNTSDETYISLPEQCFAPFPQPIGWRAETPVSLFNTTELLYKQKAQKRRRAMKINRVKNNK